jgi:hypothetical protein
VRLEGLVKLKIYTIYNYLITCDFKACNNLISDIIIFNIMGYYAGLRERLMHNTLTV